jgi:uncharacterized protein (DUF3820 family)
MEAELSEDPRKSFEALCKRCWEPITIVIMPFGKHRGEKVEDICKDDADYCRWLFKQPWFSTDFPDLKATMYEIGNSIKKGSSNA